MTDRLDRPWCARAGVPQQKRMRHVGSLCAIRMMTGDNLTVDPKERRVLTGGAGKGVPMHTLRPRAHGRVLEPENRPRLTDVG
jgi:hypothetical protein